jgi:DNA-directed RNA polymerase sigma subunit (sigma70/sigma32)
MTAPRPLEAIARRDGRWWFIEIPELDTGGQSRRYSDVQAVATEIAALYLDVSEADVAVTVRIEASERARDLWEDAERLEAESRAVQQRAAQLRREAVRHALDDDYTHTAAAAAFGISRSRVQQLERDSASHLRNVVADTSASEESSRCAGGVCGHCDACLDRTE